MRMTVGGHGRGGVGGTRLRRRDSATCRPGAAPSDRRPVRHRRRRHRHAERDAAVARRRQDDVPRIAAGRRRRRNVRPGSGFHVRRRIHRADGGPARRVRCADHQADAGAISPSPFYRQPVSRRWARPHRFSGRRSGCAARSPPRRARRLPADQAAMLPALVLGDTSALTGADRGGVPDIRADASDGGVRERT